MTTVFDEQPIKLLVQSLPFGFALRRKFGQQHRRHGAIFIASVSARQVSMGLFEAEDKVLRADLIDLVANPLETGKHVAVTADAKALGNATNHVARDEGFDHKMIGCQLAGRLKAS